MKITFDHSRQDTAHTFTFFFRPDRPVDYSPGQFVEITIPHDNPDNRGVKRWFTLSSSPTNDVISITTRFQQENGSSFKAALMALKHGQEVTMSDPMGDFVMPKLADTPLVFVAAGIGVTPFLSMLQWLSDTDEIRPIKMIQAVTTEDDIAFQDIFNGANQHVTIIVSSPTDAWGGERGHITAEMILGLETPTDDSLIYISGPEQLVETMTEDLQAAGLRKSQIVGDYFPGYAAEELV